MAPFPAFQCRSYLARAGLAAAICVYLLAQTAAAAVLEQWHWRLPSPQGNPLHQVIHAHDQFLAVGDMGSILTSSNLTNWVRENSGSQNSLYDAASGGDGTCVVVGAFGTLLHSTDTKNWTSSFGGTFFALNGVAYGNGQFVAVGANSTILTSDDGATWTPRSSGPFELFDVAHGANRFVAVGEQGNILVSTNGITWTRQASSPYSTFHSISFVNGRFIASGTDEYFNTGEVWMSPTGENWTRQTTGSYVPLLAITHGQGRWVAVGGEIYGFSAGQGGIWISDDAVTWSRAASFNLALTDVIHADGRFVATVSDGTFLVSSNGIDWPSTPSNPPSQSGPHTDIRYFNHTFVAVGGRWISFSDDGATWTYHQPFTNSDQGTGFQSIAYGHDRFVAGGEYRTVWTSTDGLNWTNPAPELSVEPYVADVYGMVFANDIFVGVAGPYGDVLTSPDGLSWNVQRLVEEGADSFRFAGVTHGNGTFVAVGGDRGEVAVSANGSDWLLLDSPLGVSLAGVVHGSGMFVAVGHDVVATSIDGTNWNRQLSPGWGTLRDVAFGSGMFVAVGGGFDEFPRPTAVESPIWISRDGVHWSRRSSATARGLHAVAYGNGTFVTAGVGGAILQSDPLVWLSIQSAPEPQIILRGPVHRDYLIESSGDLPAGASWQSEGVHFADQIPFLPPITPTRSAPSKFYRAQLLPMAPP